VDSWAQARLRCCYARKNSTLLKRKYRSVEGSMRQLRKFKEIPGGLLARAMKEEIQ
jgi:hypothetical protein